MRRFCILFVSLVVACFDPPQNDGDSLNQYDDDDLPSGSCRDTGTDTEPCDTEGTSVGDTDTDTSTPSTTGDAVEDACQASTECSGGVCVASFDPATLQRGPLDCRFMCVPDYDDASWCADASACCTAGATCTQRGYCVPP